MTEIKGRPTEFEAAVIGVVLDRIAQEEQEAAERQARTSPVLPPWMRVVRDGQHHPLDATLPFRPEPI